MAGKKPAYLPQVSIFLNDNGNPIYRASRKTISGEYFDSYGILKMLQKLVHGFTLLYFANPYSIQASTSKFQMVLENISIISYFYI